MYKAALTALGRTFDTYEVRATGYGPSADVMENYCLVIWVMAGPRHRLRSPDYAQVQRYLDRGGRVLVSEPGGATSAFHTDYLHSQLASSSPLLTLQGVSPLSGSYAYFTDAETDTTAALTPTAGGQGLFQWAGQSAYGAIGYSGAYRSVYLSLGLQNVSLTSRNAFLGQLLDWLGCPRCRLLGDVNDDGVVDVVDISLVTTAWGATADNPLYRRRLDRTLDGVIDAVDAQVVAGNWAARCSP